jgi:DNA-binding NarL/FixJ family response regulator
VPALDESTRIVLAEDHPFFLGGLRRALEKAGSITVVGEASDGPTALAQVRSLEPDVAILDIGLPRMNGFEVVRAIRSERRPVEIVFLTIHDDEDMFEGALQLGVKGYLLKDCTDAELLRCIGAVRSGQHYASPSMTSYLVKKTQRIERFAERVPGLRRLTPHERTILRLIAQDKTSKEIAGELGIARKTVDAHRANMCQKLEIHGQHVLARFAARHRQEL